MLLFEHFPKLITKFLWVLTPLECYFLSVGIRFGPLRSKPQLVLATFPPRCVRDFRLGLLAQLGVAFLTPGPLVSTLSLFFACQNPILRLGSCQPRLSFPSVGLIINDLSSQPSMEWIKNCLTRRGLCYSAWAFDSTPGTKYVLIGFPLIGFRAALRCLWLVNLVCTVLSSFYTKGKGGFAFDSKNLCYQKPCFLMILSSTSL